MLHEDSWRTLDIILLRMSINAKNLSYGTFTRVSKLGGDIEAYGRTESHEPAFLRRLRNEAGGQDPVRHARQLTRPKKQKHLSDDEDDAPTYVDEASRDVVTKKEFEALINRTEERDPRIKDSSPTLEEEEQQKQVGGLDEPLLEVGSSKEQIASIGAGSKRRFAKVVGDEEVKQPEPITEGSKRTNVAKIKKDKRIKLSFDE